MARDIPLGNGQLLVAFDGAYAIRDLHYPNLGLENHLMGRRCRIGVRVEDRFSWIGTEGWDVRLGYERDSLVSDVGLDNVDLGISIATRRPVLEDIVQYAPATVELATVAFVLSLVVGIPLGIAAAVRRDTWVDSAARAVSLLGVSSPTFWLAPAGGSP